VRIDKDVNVGPLPQGEADLAARAERADLFRSMSKATDMEVSLIRGITPRVRTFRLAESVIDNGARGDAAAADKAARSPNSEPPERNDSAVSERSVAIMESAVEAMEGGGAKAVPVNSNPETAAVAFEFAPYTTNVLSKPSYLDSLDFDSLSDTDSMPDLEVPDGFYLREFRCVAILTTTPTSTTPTPCTSTPRLPETG
jgi:hypothetical protein